MPNVLVNDDSLKAIGNAIRGKNGETTTYKPAEMAAAITAISSSGDSPTDEELTFSDNCGYLDYRGNIDWLFEKYKNRIKVSNATQLDYAFYYSKLNELPDITVNFTNNNNSMGFSNFAYGMTLKKLPSLNGTITNPKAQSPYYLGQTFKDPLTALKIDVPWDFVTKLYVNCPSSQTASLTFGEGAVFNGARLKNHWDISYLKIKQETPSSYYYSPYYQTFKSALDMETINIPVFNYLDGVDINLFYETFDGTSAVSSVKFYAIDEVDGVKWSKQVISLQNGSGYSSYPKDNYKNSRYNHDGAVETINSLPDTSAYLATAGGTNTIKFKGEAGSATEGGAINTMTEEEIAVATAKGWTVSFV